MKTSGWAIANGGEKRRSKRLDMFVPAIEIRPTSRQTDRIAGLLGLVFRIVEPIPAIDTFVESDWRIKRDAVNGISAIRVLAGYESPEGILDPEQARGYWFDNAGLLVKTHFNGIETIRSDSQDFNGTKVARRVDVLKDGRLAMRIRVLELSNAGVAEPKTFEIKGHEWTRAFSSEGR